MHDGEAAQIKVHASPGERALVLEVRGAPAGSLLNLVSRARRTFDLAVDPLRILAAFRPDPLLAPLVRRCPGLRIPGVWDGLECAVRAVLGQGLGEAEQRLVSRLVRSCGSQFPSSPGSAGRLTHLFPTAEALAQATLGGIGLAAPQIAALKALARASLEGRLDFEAPAEDLIAVLVSLPGMNAFTAHDIALRALGEPDAFPIADADSSRPVPRSSCLLGGPTLAELAEVWRPWRAYAALHLCREMQAPEEPPARRGGSEPRRQGAVAAENALS